LLLAAFTLHVSEHKLRVIAPDVGGGFGSKIFHYAEELLVLWASRRVGRPVKWTADRSEAFISDAHGRDHISKAQLAMDKDGKFLGLRVHTLANMGAYLSTFAPAVPDLSLRHAALWPVRLPGDLRRGQGDLHQHRRGRRLPRRRSPRGHATCSSAWSTRRRARPASIAIELRRQEPHPAFEQFPYQTQVALQYDIGDYQATLDLALAKIDHAGYPAAPGRVRGPRQAARHRHVHVHRGLRHRPVGAGGRAGRARRPI
jgi:carbon-monoxide dehydrogenase large subunit